MHSIKCQYRNSSGKTFAYVLEDETLLSIDDAFKLVRTGKIENFIIGVNKNGEK